MDFTQLAIIFVWLAAINVELLQFSWSVSSALLWVRILIF